MSPVADFISDYDIEVKKIAIEANPLQASIFYSSLKKENIELILSRPQPVQNITEALYHCYEIRIFDKNSEGNNLEFGRYSVELWDEEDSYSKFIIDGFELINL